MPDETRINSENVAVLLPRIKKAIHLFALDNPVATTAEEIGGIISNYLNVQRCKATSNDIINSYRKTILMLASYEVKAASEATATSASFIPFINQTIVSVSTDPDNNYTITNLENFRTGGSKSIRTQILDKLVERVHKILVERVHKTRKGGRSRSNKRSNKRSAYRRRRSSKRQSRKVSKARSTRRK